MGSPSFPGENPCRRAEKRPRDDIAEKVPAPNEQQDSGKQEQRGEKPGAGFMEPHEKARKRSCQNHVAGRKAAAFGTHPEIEAMSDAAHYIRRIGNSEKYFQHVIVNDVGAHRDQAGHRQSLSEQGDTASHQACENREQDNRRLRRQNDSTSECNIQRAAKMSGVPEVQRGPHIYAQK